MSKNTDENTISNRKGEIIMRAVNIKWDVTDGAEDMTKEDMDEILSTLPTEVEIPDYLTTDDEDDLLDDVSDWLSDEYGFCHDGFELVN